MKRRFILFFAALLFSPVAFSQTIKLVKSTLVREVSADKKVTTETCFVDFEKRAAYSFVVDSVKAAGGKKLSYTFYMVEMVMGKDDVQWKHRTDYPPEQMGLFQLSIVQKKDLQWVDLGRGFTIYAHDNGKPVQLKVDKIDHLPETGGK